jgi:GLPGLI family protein
MIKKIVITLVLILSINHTKLYSQEVSGKITYNVSLNAKKDDVDSKIKKNKKLKNIDKHTKATLKKLFQDAEDVIGILEFNNREALYQLKEQMDNDFSQKINLTKSSAGGLKKFYTSKEGANTNNIEQDCKILGECFIISNENPVWQITQETKKIGDYTCYKAINTSSTNRNKPVAWFTPKIPANFGPKNFHGLPGLILELDISSVTFRAIKIEINPKKKIKIKEPTKGKKVTREEYRKILRKSFPEFYKK